MKNLFNLKALICAGALLVPIISFAADAVPDMPAAAPDADYVSIFMLSALGFAILVLLAALYILFALLNHINQAAAEKPLFERMISSLTDTVPVEDEAVILTDHVYDGIRELDNNLPPWWKYLFYATIVYSFVYIYYYHFSDSKQLQAQEYEQELLTAEQDKLEYMKHAANSIDETNVSLADADGIAKGKALFASNCTACHGKAAEGGVGPNLTDDYWLHGGALPDVFKTIKYGVPQKGMIAWQAQMSPLNLQQLSSYIMTLKGTNPANAKAAQGDKYEAKK